MSIIKLEAVSKIYGQGDNKVEALKPTDFEAHKGEVIIFVGPSGSGKTTLLTVAGCLMKPSTGRVIIDGEDITPIPQRKLASVRLAKIGFVFQSFHLMEALSAQENVELACNVAGLNGKKAKDKAAGLLVELGLENRLKHLPKELSGGEKQRVAIARALVNEPDIIIADEPTANLDSKTGHFIVELFSDLIKNQNKCIIIATHDNRILDVASKIIMLEDGQIAADRLPFQKENTQEQVKL